MNSMLRQALREFSGPLNQLIVNCSGKEGDSWWKEFMKFLRKEPCWVDNIICVDRIVPLYPEWVEKPLFPELEKTEPSEYGIVQIKEWFHQDQKRGPAKGFAILEYLKSQNILKSCAGLSDLLAIEAKGIDFFLKHFAGKAVFGWQSVVQRRDGDLFVPYLVEHGEGVVLGWRWLELDWDSRGPALYFASIS